VSGPAPLVLGGTLGLGSSVASVCSGVDNVKSGRYLPTKTLADAGEIGAQSRGRERRLSETTDYSVEDDDEGGVRVTSSVGLRVANKQEEKDRGMRETGSTSRSPNRRFYQSQTCQRSLDFREGKVCCLPGLYTMKNNIEFEVRGMSGTEDLSLYLNGGEVVLETSIKLTLDFTRLRYTLTPMSYRLHSLDLLLRFRNDERGEGMQPCAVVSRRVGVLCCGQQNVLPSVTHYEPPAESAAG
ncbi:unnamed protein product, partial [Amoebophrya sp. A25]